MAFVGNLQFCLIYQTVLAGIISLTGFYPHFAGLILMWLAASALRFKVTSPHVFGQGLLFLP